MYSGSRVQRVQLERAPGYNEHIWGKRSIDNAVAPKNLATQLTNLKYDVASLNVAMLARMTS